MNRPSNMDSIDYSRVSLSFLAVILLILAIAWVIKKFGLHQRFQTIASPKSRLQTIDRLTLDPKHRLVIIRRDAKEHLILLGATNPLLIESYDAPDIEESR